MTLFQPLLQLLPSQTLQLLLAIIGSGSLTTTIRLGSETHPAANGLRHALNNSDATFLISLIDSQLAVVAIVG